MTEAPLKVTLKQGTGYDAPWITVDGNDPNEVNTRLRALLDGGVLETVAEVAGAFRATALTGEAPAPQQAQPQAAPQQQAPQPAQGWGQQQPQQQAAPQGNGAKLHPEGEQCTQCGQVLQYKVVNRKSDGKQFTFWSCPAGRSRDDGHTSKFA